MLKFAFDNAPPRLQLNTVLQIVREGPVSPDGRQGYSNGEVRTAMRVIDKIEAAIAADADKPVLLLEQQESEWLQRRMAQVTWRIANDEVIAILDIIEKPEKVQVQEAPPVQ